MTFTEPEIGKTKRMTVKPFTRNYDPRTKAAVKNKNLVEQFRELLISTVPSAVGLHLLPDTGLNKATGVTEELRTQNNESDPFLSSDNVSLSRQEHPFHLGYIYHLSRTTPQVLMKLSRRHRE